MANKIYGLLIVVMLLALAMLAIGSMKQTSPVYDEVSHHIATGYSFLKTADFRLNSTSPPLTEELAALPLLFLKPVLPLQDPSWNNIDRVTFGYQFLYKYNSNAGQIVFWSRIPMVILSVLCGLLVFIFANDIYGKKAGLFALFLYAFSPNIIAYSGLNVPDMGATFFILLAFYRFYKFLRKPKTKNILFAGLSLGLAEASKLSALLLLPLFIIIAIWRSVSSKSVRYLKGILCIMLICYAVVFAAYFGEIKPLLKNDIDVQEKIAYIEKAVDKVFPVDNLGIKNRAINFALNAPIPFATYIMNILAEINMMFVKDYRAWLMGMSSTGGWWYFYPIVFLLKTPIPTLIFLMMVMAYYKRLKAGNRLPENLILCFIIAFSIACIRSKVMGGVRYILPIYPFIFIFVSKIVNLKIAKKLLLNFFMLALCVWYLIGAVIIYPHYISYFNEFAGGADNGWRYLRGSNIDFGQDLPSLASYMKKNKIDEINLHYCGTAEPAYYGIRYKQFNQKDFIDNKTGVYAVGADAADLAQGEKPTAKAGYSIFIYDFRDKAKTR